MNLTPWQQCADAGMTAAQAAEHLGLPLWKARKASEEGVRFVRKKRTDMQPRKADPARVRELAAEGYSQSTIADLVGVSRERIRQICNRDGIETVWGGANADLEDRVTELIGAGMSAKEIESEIGCGCGTAQRIASRLGLTLQWKGRRPGSSGHRGVVFHKPTGAWRASVYRDGHTTYLGYYDTIADAVAAREAYLARVGAA
jgi:hypothetical protein